MTYDEAQDSRLSYDVAINAIREQKIASGEIEPWTRKEVIGGAHLYLGDAREILPTIRDADLLCTDAPYLVTSGGFGALEGGFSGWIKDSYDNKGAIVECDLDWGDWLPLAFESCRDPAHAYLFSNDRNLPKVWKAASDAGFEFHRLLTWNKKTALPNRWYIQSCEFVWFGRRGKAFQIADCGYMALQTMQQRGGTPHPTEKPVALCELYIGNSTKPGQTVLDPFMGSGTTGVAALNLGRKFIGIEIDETYFDIACERMREALRQPRLFADPTPKPTQDSMQLEIT